MKWTTRDKHEIEISDMTEDHIRNSMAMLRRTAIKRCGQHGLFATCKTEEACEYAIETVLDTWKAYGEMKRVLEQRQLSGLNKVLSGDISGILDAF